MVAWGVRYMLVGAGVGLFLGAGSGLFPLLVFPLAVSPVIFMPGCGAVVGTVLGCLGGVLEGWLTSGVGGKSVP
jgi:hypothetical protein